MKFENPKTTTLTNWIIYSHLIIATLIVFWKTSQQVLNLKPSSTIPTLIMNNDYADTDHQKANMLNEYFSSQTAVDDIDQQTVTITTSHPTCLRINSHRGGERGGSVVECRTPEREVGGSKPTAAVLCPWARRFTPRKYWLIAQEAVAPSRHDWKIVDWDVKPQHNQPTKSSPNKT